MDSSFHSTHFSGISSSVSGRICASPNCQQSSNLQPWENFAKKGNRHTSRCKTCLSIERKMSYRQKQKAAQTRKVRILKTTENIIFEPASSDIESVLTDLAVDAFVGITE